MALAHHTIMKLNDEVNQASLNSDMGIFVDGMLSAKNKSKRYREY
ncbi:hypothetical protein [Spirulina major]|nr:hypothetical protein [Spirulina major]